MKKIKVMTIDDSAYMRNVLKAVIESDSELEVVADAEDPLVARDIIKQTNPDVLILDIEMPKMDGITFLKKLMQLRPMPVIMFSAYTQQGTEASLDALQFGAIDVVAKPTGNIEKSIENLAGELIEKIKVAAKAKIIKHSEAIAKRASTGRPCVSATVSNALIAVGASTGGTEAIKDLLLGLPENTPGILVTQHIPACFSKPFATRLDGLLPHVVCEAENNMPIESGHVYVAPGDQHLKVKTKGGQLVCQLDSGERVSGHRPSVDVMFSSVGETMRCSKIMGILLTGMGEDGARGLKLLQQKGAQTIAQDEESSVVWGMPGAAVNLDAANKVVNLFNIAGHIKKFYKL